MENQVKERLILALMAINNEVDDDDDEYVLTILNFIRLRIKRNRSRRLATVNRVLKLFYDKNRINYRVTLSGFPELVWRYSDVQFSEDFRMPRERFQVNQARVIYLFRILIDSERAGAIPTDRQRTFKYFLLLKRTTHQQIAINSLDTCD